MYRYEYSSTARKLDSYYYNEPVEKESTKHANF